MNWNDCRIVAFDTETTGLLAWDGDRVMEFGAVEIRLDDNLNVTDVKRHGWLIDPGMSIPRDASRITGIQDEDVHGKPRFEKRAAQIREILDDAIVVAHNLPFDLGFIKAELARCGLSWPKTRAELDTLTCSQRHNSHLRKHNLGFVSKSLGVALEEAHRAVNDAEACGLVFIEMARRYDAPKPLADIVIWADGVQPPPDTGHLTWQAGSWAFVGGEHDGEAIDNHLDYLHWMTLSLERVGGEWQPRFPEEFRVWARHYLRVRASGTAPQNPKGGGATDWNLDPVAWA